MAFARKRITILLWVNERPDFGLLHGDARQSAHTDRPCRRVAEIDASAFDERPAIVNPHPHRPAVGLVRHRDAAAEAPGAMGRRQGVGVEALARRRPAAVVAIANAIVAGDASLHAGHGDVDRADAGKNVLCTRRRGKQ